MDPEGAAVEQLYKKGTSLGRHREQGRRSSTGEEQTGRAVVKALEQERQGSDSASASSKVYDLGRLHILLCLRFPLCEMGTISTSVCKGLHHVKT